MSDHEDFGTTDWDEGSLPGGPALASGHDSLTKPVYQRTNLSSFHPQSLEQRRDFVRPAGVFQHTLRNQQMPQQHLGFRPEIRGLEGRTSGIQARQGTVQYPEVENAAYISFKNGCLPTGQYNFSVTFEELLRNIPEEGVPASRVARDRLDQIAKATGTYIPTPEFNSIVATIYGDQYELAREQLAVFERDIRGSRGIRHSSNYWIKMSALDGRREHREEREQTILQQLKASHLWNSDRNFPVDDFFHWPSEIDLESFITEYDGAMNEIRRRKKCRINYDTENRLIQTSALSEADIVEIRNRFVGIIREMMVARQNRRLRTNLIHLPSASTFRDRVGLSRDQITGLFMPTLFGDQLSLDEAEQWAKTRLKINRRNREKLRRALSTTIENLQLSNSHVRMRVTFGELGFRRHRRQADGEDAHSFTEFCEMVQNERTELQQQSIRSTGGDISGIVGRLNEMESLGEPEQGYSVYYDFQTESSNSTLRLQSEFRPLGLDSKEVETTGSRWLEFRPGAQSELLEVNMLDFERPDWQLHLGATRFSNNNRTKAHLEAFQHNLGFNPPENGITSHPKRRAVFPPGHKDLHRVSELYLLRYPFKDTEGILELRRTDVYEEGPGRSSPHPASSLWTASYYLPFWDNLLGELADLKPGDQLSWHRSLATFFPDDPNDEKAKGFIRFFRDVQKIQGLLADAITNLLPTRTNGASAGRPSSIGGNSDYQGNQDR